MHFPALWLIIIFFLNLNTKYRGNLLWFLIFASTSIFKSWTIKTPKLNLSWKYTYKSLQNILQPSSYRWYPPSLCASCIQYWTGLHSEAVRILWHKIAAYIIDEHRQRVGHHRWMRPGKKTILTSWGPYIH